MLLRKPSRSAALLVRSIPSEPLMKKSLAMGSLWAPGAWTKLGILATFVLPAWCAQWRV